MALTVVTFNVRNALGRDRSNIWPLRRRATATVLGRLQPDVAAVQEAFRCQVRYLVRRLPGYDVAGTGRNDGANKGEHCAVLFRADRLRLERQATRWFSDTPDVPGSRTWGNALPRIATLAWFTDRVDGSRFGVADVHLDERSDAVRERSLATLLEWLAELRHRAPVAWADDRPWLIVGDFNATPAAASVRAVLDAGWRDALSHLPASGRDANTAHAFTGEHDGDRIDHILMDKSWTVEDAGIVHDRPRGRLPSDHWPVVARLRTRPQVAPAHWALGRPPDYGQ